MLTSLLSKIGLPLLIEFVARALSRIDNPIAKSASEALDEVESALQSGVITSQDMAEAHRHAEVMAEMRVAEVEARLHEVNESLRAEIISDDKYVRRMRPTFGYLMAVTWAAQMLGLAYIIVFETEKAGHILQGMASLSTIWGVGLSVLGIYVYKRSEDKKLYHEPFHPPVVETPVTAFKKKIQIRKEALSVPASDIHYNE